MKVGENGKNEFLVVMKIIIAEKLITQVKDKLDKDYGLNSWGIFLVFMTVKNPARLHWSQFTRNSVFNVKLWGFYWRDVFKSF